MTKRWKTWLGVLALVLASVAVAWGDLVIDEYQYRGGPAWVSDSMGRAMLGAVFGGALVGVAFWPGWLMARVRSGKEAKGHPVIMEYVVLMMLIVAAIVAVGMVFGNLLPNLARQIPMGVWMVCAGEAVLAGVALVCGQRAESRVGGGVRSRGGERDHASGVGDGQGIASPAEGTAGAAIPLPPR